MKRNGVISNILPLIVWLTDLLLVWLSFQVGGIWNYLLIFLLPFFLVLVPLIIVKQVEKEGLVQWFGLQSERFLLLVLLLMVSIFAIFMSGIASWGIFLSVILAPIPEEVFFRGYIQRKLMKKNSILIPLFVTSIIFGLSHVFKYWNSLTSIFLVTVLGLGTGICFLSTESILLPAVFHTMWNILASWNPNNSPSWLLPFWTILIILPSVLLHIAEHRRKVWSLMIRIKDILFSKWRFQWVLGSFSSRLGQLLT